jgi:transcriptional regulator with XRE-family HTH domain
VSFDYSKLRGKIKEHCGTQAVLAQRMGLSHAALSDKLNEKSDFSRNEISKMCDILNIPRSEIDVYFFTEVVKKT